MRIEYSPAALLALNKAALISQQAGLTQVGPMHLLRGLMDEEEGHPVLLVRAAGVSMDNLRGLLPFCEVPGEVAADLPLAAATAQVLSHAWELARLHGAEGSVTSDYLLLAILEVDLPTRSLLEGIGLDFNALKDRITPSAQPF